MVKWKQARVLLLVAGAICAGTAALPGSAGAGSRALGIDVSRFQNVITWSSVPSSGVKFAFVQASRGSGTDCTVKPDQCGADPYWGTNRDGAEAAGIRVGAYHRAFATGSTDDAARADAIAEADLFISQVGSIRSGELLPVLDVESPFTGMTATSLRTWIRTWLKRVGQHLGRKAMIYTNASSWGATGNTAEFAKARYPLWVAQWNVAAPAVPANNWAKRGYSVWQFSNSGSISGISGRVDQDRLGVGLAKITVK
jgi:GH25 family lysozyme M1 (1,4-beta-N-acetylmuramidase)